MNIIFLIALIVSFALTAASLRAAHPDIQIVSSTAEAFEATILTSATLDDVIIANDSVGQRVYKTFLIGIPYGSTPILTTVDGAGSIPYQHQSEIQTTSGSLAELSPVTTVRGRQLVTLTVFPVQGGRVISEIQVRITFTGSRLSLAMSESDDTHFDRVLANGVVNAEQFLSWPRYSARQMSASTAVSSHPFEFSDEWFKVEIDLSSNGQATDLYRITGAELEDAGFVFNNVASTDVRLFSAGGLPLPFSNAAARPVLRELPILIVDGGDGRFDRSDIIYFVGEKTNRWLYRPGVFPQYNNNIYTSRNVYWLTSSGTFPTTSLRMATRDVALSGTVDTIITNFRRYAHVEQDNLIGIEASGFKIDYYHWQWTDQSSLQFFFPAQSPVIPSTANILLIGQTGREFLSGDTIDYMELRINGQFAQNGSCNPFNCTYTTNALADGLNQVDLALGRQSFRAGPYFDYFEINYTAHTVPQSGKLDLPLGQLNGRGEVRVTDNFSAAPWLFDISDPMNPQQLTGFTRNAGVVRFEDDFTTNVFKRYFALVPGLAGAVTAVRRTTVNDLREQIAQTDCVIVTSQPLSGRLNAYVNYWDNRGLTFKIVTVADIMDNFGFGLYDPTAIRDYLKFTYENFSSPAPYASLFVGDANYDYLNRLQTNQPNHVPVYIQAADESYSDDNYVYFGQSGLLVGDTANWLPGDGFDMMTARWPVSSGSEIDVIVNKTISYESPSTLGDWRNNVVLVADDQFHPGSTTETFHLEQTEQLQELTLPREFNRKKIYAWEYPFVNREKPGVNDAIVNSINEGALIVNYVGHGNPDVWSDEGIFRRSSDLPRLVNTDKLPFVFAASCDIGFFDDPRREAMGEDFLAMPDRGAIAVIAALRLVFAFDNSEFNKQAYRVLFRSDSLSMCEAIYTAKLERQYRGGRFRPVENDQQYVFFGDPFLRLGEPRHSLQFSEIPDSLEALSRSRVVGSVIASDSSLVIQDGRLFVAVFDNDRMKLMRAFSGNVPVDSVLYQENGPLLYKGLATITDGRFDFEFITPVDVGYGGKAAKIMMYAQLQTSDAHGLIDSLPVASTVAVVTDSVGPLITIGIDGRENFISGDHVSRSERLELTLQDSSGINLSGSVGHGITIEVDGNTANTIDVTTLFSYEPDDITRGRLVIDLDTLPAGEHTLKIKAWDNANNSSTALVTLHLVESTSFALNALLNHPNPMIDTTTFYFELTQPTERFTLDIFTIAGRKVKSFQRFGLSADNYPNSSVALIWDGRDTDGDRVATGVYIYKASALPSMGGEVHESFGKIVVINQ